MRDAVLQTIATGGQEQIGGAWVLHQTQLGFLQGRKVIQIGMNNATMLD